MFTLYDNVINVCVLQMIFGKTIMHNLITSLWVDVLNLPFLVY